MRRVALVEHILQSVCLCALVYVCLFTCIGLRLFVYVCSLSLFVYVCWFTFVCLRALVYVCLFTCVGLRLFVVAWQSVMNRMHVISIPYSLMKVNPLSWIQKVHTYKGKAYRLGVGGFGWGGFWWGMLGWVPVGWGLVGSGQWRLVNRGLWGAAPP